MKIIKSMTIDISEAELKQIIVEHLKNEGIETDVDKVKFNLGTKWVGSQRDGSYDPYIKSCTVKCEMKCNNIRCPYYKNPKNQIGLRDIWEE